MEREQLSRLVLAELAKPRWEGKFGPSSWDVRATLQREGATISAPELAGLLASLREQGLIRYQAARGAAQSTTMGNLRITPQGREQLQRWTAAPSES
jgi:DNA-binding PadR family transcriptional regulator